MCAEPRLPEHTERALDALIRDLGTDLDNVGEQLDLWSQVIAGRLPDAGGEGAMLRVDGEMAVLRSFFDSCPDVSFPVLEMDQILQGYLDWVESLHPQL